MAVALTEHALRVLVLAPIGRDAATVAGLLQRAGITAAICADFTAMMLRLDEGAGALFVAEEGLFGRPLEQLAEWVAAQPPRSDLPLVMLTSDHPHRAVADWRREQVARLGNVSLIERPVEPISLVSVMQAALRARRRQLEICELMEARKASAANPEALVDRRTAQLQALNAQLREEMAERIRVEESLRRTQKLESLGQLTGGVAHDFNNILMVVNAGLEMLERNDSPERRQKLMQGMRQGHPARRRPDPAVAGVLAQPRAAPGDGAPDPAGRRHGRAAAWQPARRHPPAGGAGCGPVAGVRRSHELEMAILNMAVNARDAMDGSGTLTVTADNVVADTDAGDGPGAGDAGGHAHGPDDGLAAHAPRARGQFVRLTVRDTGAGMTEEVKARVFEPFFTTKDVGKGSGLGLTYKYGFVRQSGGSVVIDSAPGQGATITLLLPRSHEAVAEASAADGQAGAPADGPGACVLLVEDDAEVAAFVEELLHSLGHAVVRAASAKAALGALADGREVGLVFSDIMMPGGTSGIDLAREIRQRQPTLPVLLTSGYAGAGAREAEAMGIEILRKPYGIEDLRAAVARVRGARPDAHAPVGG